MKIEDILTIAGKAHRRRIEVRTHINAEQGVFPHGADDFHFAVEIAQCESLIAIAEALLATHLLLLSFDENGCAVATAPKSLRDGEDIDRRYNEAV